MNKKVTLILSVFATTLAMAQPQLKCTNLTIGDMFDIYLINNITISNLASNGPNVSWSTTAGTPVLAATAKYISPSSTTFGSTYPDANLACELVMPTGTSYIFYKNSTNGLEQIAMDLGTPSPKIYTTYKLDLGYIMNYGDSITRPFQRSGQSASSITLKYDAYGTLTTSDSVYTNVGRVFDTDLSGNIHVTWYSGNTRQVILLWNGSSFMYFKKKYTTGITEISGASALSVYPNPAKNKIEIICPETIYPIRIADITGKTLIESNENKVNVSELKSGLYFIKVKTINGEMIKKFVKE